MLTEEFSDEELDEKCDKEKYYVNDSIKERKKKIKFLVKFRRRLSRYLYAEAKEKLSG